MTPEELRQLIQNIVLNQTDTAQLTEGLEKITSAYTELHTTNETVRTSLEQKEQSIKDLQKVNMDFFLRLNNPTKEDPEKKAEPEKSLEELALEFKI